MEFNNFCDKVSDQLQELHSSDADEFTETIVDEESDIKISIEGNRKDSDRWGENKYAVDCTLDIIVQSESDWDEFSTEISNWINKLKPVISEPLGYNGPIVIRSSTDEKCRSWARRIIHKEES